jgi:diacylglycerol kinase
MAQSCSLTDIVSDLPDDRPARPAWRQRLVDIERGTMQGVRGDSIFFVYFFLSSITIAAAVVLRLSLLQWTIVILSLTLVLCAEMFNQVLKSLIAGLAEHLGDAAQTTLRIGTAAVFVATTGSIVVIGLTLGQAFVEMFEEF